MAIKFFYPNTDISLEKHPSKSDTQMKTLEVYQLSTIFLNVRYGGEILTIKRPHTGKFQHERDLSITIYIEKKYFPLIGKNCQIF